MTELKKDYEKLFLEKVEENIKLKNELETYKKKLQLCKTLKKETQHFDKCFYPLQREYEHIHFLLKFLFAIIQELKNIYNKRLLLNPNFANVKLRKEEKMQIINETRPILHKCYIKAIPPLKDFYIDEPRKGYACSIFPTCEKTETKKFVVKKGK